MRNQPQGAPERRIFVRGDRAITYGRVMEVMGTISAGRLHPRGAAGRTAGRPPVPRRQRAAAARRRPAAAARPAAPGSRAPAAGRQQRATRLRGVHDRRPSPGRGDRTMASAEPLGSRSRLAAARRLVLAVGALISCCATCSISPHAGRGAGEGIAVELVSPGPPQQAQGDVPAPAPPRPIPRRTPAHAPSRRRPSRRATRRPSRPPPPPAAAARRRRPRAAAARAAAAAAADAARARRRRRAPDPAAGAARDRSPRRRRPRRRRRSSSAAAPPRADPLPLPPPPVPPPPEPSQQAGTGQTPPVARPQERSPAC